jgi:hypothetical protein
MNRDMITQLLKPKTKIEISKKIYAKATYYANGLTKVFIPNIPYEKLMPDFELRHEPSTDSTSSSSLVMLKTSNEDNLERSLRRSKQLVADYALNNPFELFSTFTFSPKKTANRQDPDLVKSQMSNWLKNQQTRTGKFAYLIVPELHKDGKSLHFHALFAGYEGVLLDSGEKINGRKAYNFKSYTLGINSAVRIDNIEAVSSYIRKYITKDMPQFHGKHRYWATKSLMRPRTEDNPDEWYLRETAQKVYVSEYGRTLFFTGLSQATPRGSLTEDSTARAHSETTV